MAASSRSSVSTKIWALAVGILLVIALYTAGWFYAASTLKEKTLALLGDQQRHGVSAVCQDAEYRGYPFRIGLFCSKVSVDDKTNGVSATFGALRSAAQIYQPNHIVWELDGPAETRTGTGIAASSQWESLQSSLITSLGGVDRSSTVITGLKTGIISTQTNQSFEVKVAHTEAHLRQNGNDLDAAITLQDTDITSKGAPQIVPRFTAVGDVTLAGKAALLAGQDAGRGIYGTKGEMRRLGIDLGNGQSLSITGPFSVGDDGRISGKLRVEVGKLSAWRDQIKASAPQLAKTVDTATKMLSAMTGGGDRAAIDLTLNNGKVILGGFIAIGEIPPL